MPSPATSLLRTAAKLVRKNNRDADSGLCQVEFLFEGNRDTITVWSNEPRLDVLATEAT